MTGLEKTIREALDEAIWKQANTGRIDVCDGLPASSECSPADISIIGPIDRDEIAQEIAAAVQRLLGGIGG